MHDNKFLTTLSIIPARGGSKRIPHKNLKNFLGKPIISYPIRSAIESKCFDEVMVSTDDTATAKIAKSLGAKVPFMRSKKNSNDYATTVDVLLEVLADYHKLRKHFDLVCCIYPTSVSVTIDVIKNAKKMMQSGINGVATIVPFEHPINRAIKLDIKNTLSFKYPESAELRTQDFTQYYHDAGQLYFLKAETLMVEKKVFLSNMKPIIMGNNVVQDIDSIDNWKIAEIKFLHANQSQ